MTKEQLNKNKQELKDYIYNKKWIEGRLKDIEERKSLLNKITTTLSDMPKGSPKVQDNQVESLVKILDETKELENLLLELRKQQVDIEYKIDKVEQPYRNILYFRYIRGYNLTEVSNEIDEEYDYTRKLHGIALIKYAKVGENK
jgi:hypothetical protein